MSTLRLCYSNYLLLYLFESFYKRAESLYHPKQVEYFLMIIHLQFLLCKNDQTVVLSLMQKLLLIFRSGTAQ